MTERGPDALSSSATNHRPSKGGTLSRGKAADESLHAWTSLDDPSLLRATKNWGRCAARPRKEWLEADQSFRFSSDVPANLCRLTCTILISTKRVGSGYVSGARYIPYNKLKMAVFALIPKVRIRTATIVKPGRLKIFLTVYLKSRTICSSRITFWLRQAECPNRAIEDGPIHLAFFVRTKLHLECNHIAKQVFANSFPSWDITRFSRLPGTLKKRKRTHWSPGPFPCAETKIARDYRSGTQQPCAGTRSVRKWTDEGPGIVQFQVGVGHVLMDRL